MTNKKLVSIIVPCYNNESTIKETIYSILEQTYENIEVIIVNDGSKDNSESIINKITSENKSVSSILQENSGPSYSRNQGALAANGFYLVFIDADDVIYKNFIEEYVAAFEQNNQLQLVYSRAEFFGDKKGEWILPEYNMKNFISENCIPIFAMIKREEFLKAGMFDSNLKYLEDWDLWITITKNKNSVFRIPKILYKYRKIKNSKSLTTLNKVDDVQDASRLYIYNKHYSFFKENDFSISNLMKQNTDAVKYKNKYNNIWYRKLFKKIFKK